MQRKRNKNIAPQRSNLWQKVTTLRTLKQIHASLIINGFFSNPSAIRELIFTAAISVFGAIDYAHKMFDQIPQPDTFTWNTMIRGSAQSASPSKAILVYIQMEEHHVKPDKFTFPFVFKGCTRMNWVKMGCQIHGKVEKFGFGSSRFVRNSLIYFHANCGDVGIAKVWFDEFGKRDVVAWSAMTVGYARRGDLGNARRVFDEMPERDLVSWNVIITAYAKRGEMASARRLFDQVPRRDVITWNVMISGYVLCGCHEEALSMYEEMSSVGEVPDEVTMLSLLSACADLGDLERGKKLHRSIYEMGPKDLNLILGNALIDMYAKCGSLEGAVEVFGKMKERDVTTWNSILGGLAFHGHAEESLQLFREMRGQNIRPNAITFVAVLVACSHAGKVDEGRYYVNLMEKGYGIEPNIRHYGCMVDMLGRSGLLKEAFDFVGKMKIEPNAIIWRTLLGACRVHGNEELGRLANEELLRMRRNQSGDYVLMSNIYAEVGKWDGVEKVRNLMDDSRVRKDPGCSLIEADDEAFLQFLFRLEPKPQLKQVI